MNDKAQPETQARGFGDVDFNAMLAVDDPSALSLVRQPGTDGFRLDSTAMFQVAAGREWFIHTIYTIRPKDNDNHGIGKRSLEYHHSLVATGNDLSITPGVKGQGHRVRWSASGLVGAAVPDVADDIGADNNRGTNIMHIALDRTKRRAAGGVELYADRLEPRELSRGEGDEGLPTVVGGLVGMLLTFLLIIILVLVVRYRQKEERKERVWGSASTEGMMVARMDDCSNSSEV